MASKTTRAQAIELATKTIEGVEGVLSEPAVKVVASDLKAPAGLGVSSVELQIMFHVASDNPRYFDILSECILRVKSEFEQAGITIPSNAASAEWGGRKRLNCGTIALLQ